MNKSAYTSRSLIALSVIGAMSLPFGAFAAGETLNSWMAKSMTLVNNHMSYPGLAIRRNETGNSYVRVTIDENGHILNYEITGKSGSMSLDRASLKTVKDIKQFPAIPFSYRGDNMTFGVKLRYDLAYSEADYRKKLSKTKVTVQPLHTASNSPMSSEIVILAAN